MFIAMFLLRYSRLCRQFATAVPGLPKPMSLQKASDRRILQIYG